MADLFGAMEVPIQAPDPSETVSDPGLDYLAAYLKAYLIAKGGTAWATVAPGEPIVRTTHTHNPREQDVVVRECPTLFVWRQRCSQETLADDYEVDRSTIRILWLFPPTQQHAAAKRTPFLNAIGKLIKAAIKRERDPCYIVPGDTDTGAATRGSLVPRHCRFLWWQFHTSEIVDIEIEPGPNGDRMPPIPGVVSELEVLEKLDLDLTLMGSDYDISGDTNFADGTEDTLTEFFCD